MSEFQPRIVAFACNWCSYAGADLAGVSRMQYPATTRVIRVMCSGRVTPGFILEAFRLGADGVLVTGCHPGDCHYISGNENAVATVEKTTQLLRLLGIETERLRLEWISAAEGARFADLMSQFTEQIRTLGPSPLGDAGFEAVAAPEVVDLEKA
ncbi:MAG: hydrogenase iron-sulfur subunit [Anaerolineae bacterium]|jgi:F420-non-reducing hydrogenase iron-sulfur subunit